MAQNQTIHTVKIKGTEEIIRLRTEIVKYEKSLKKLKAEIKDTRANDGQIKGLVNLEAKLKATRKEYRDNQKALEGLNKAKKNAGSFTMKMAKAFGAAQIATQLFTRAMQAVGQAVKQAATTFKDFEFQMAKVRAISGATDVEFRKLINTAKGLGRTTFFTASQVGELQLNLSKLGFDTDEILQSQEAILNLSTAMGEDLGRTATVVAATIRGFGEDTDQTGRFADAMASAFANSALDIEKFQTSMTKVSAIAATAGFSFEETTGLLALLTDRGIEASIAGTSLRNIMLKLQDPTSDLSEKLGRTVHSGEDLIVALRELDASGIDVAGVMRIVDDRQVQAMESFIRSADAIEDFNTILTESAGSAGSMAEIMEQTVGGALLRLNSAYEGFVLSLTTGTSTFSNVIQGIIDGIAGSFNRLSSAIGGQVAITDQVVASAQTAAQSKLADKDSEIENLSTALQIEKAIIQAEIGIKRSQIALSSASLVKTQALKNEIKGREEAIKQIDKLIVEAQTEETEDAKKQAEEDKKTKIKQAENAKKLSEQLKALQEEKKSLVDRGKDLNEHGRQDIIRINKEIVAIQDLQKELQNLGIEKEKQDDTTDAKLAEIELNQILNNEKLKFAEGEIETKEMLNKSLLTLTISHLENTLKTAKLESDERMKLETQLANQKAKLREVDLKETEDNEKTKTELIKANIDNAMTIGNSLTQIGQIMGKNSAAAKAGIAITKAAAVANAINGIIAAKGAIADQADKGDPYTAFARMAMMAAAIAPLIASLVALKGEAGGGSESSGGMKHGSGSQVASGGQYARGGLTRGGMFEGASHAHGGVKFAVGGRIHEAEGGEAIINKRSTAAFRPILSAINSYNGNGVKFADGGLISSGEKFAMGGQLRSVQQIVSGGMGSAKVVMVESDVTSTQGRVSALEAQASF